MQANCPITSDECGPNAAQATQLDELLLMILAYLLYFVSFNFGFVLFCFVVFRGLN